MVGEEEDYSAALQLFRERSIAQVRDYDLELSSRVTRSYERFTRELQTHYKDILKVTDEVDRLYVDLKEGDAMFMDLCFKDDLYKLNKLADYQGETNRSSSLPIETHLVSGGQSQTLLVISSWVLAISDLISRFATSTSALKLFDSVMSEFDELKVALEDDMAYETIIKSKCEAFLQFVCSSDINLTISQWIRIYNLALNDGRQVFPWKVESIEQLEKVLFEAVFRENLDTLLGSDDELIADFVATRNFKEALNKKLLKDSQTLFERLDKLIESDTPDSPILAFPETCLTTINIPEIVQESQYYSMGLVTRQKVQWYKIITPLTGIIEKLQHHGGTSQAKELRESLVKKLQQQKPIKTSQDDKSASMSDVVSRMIDQYNDAKFTTMVESKIRSLTEIM